MPSGWAPRNALSSAKGPSPRPTRHKSGLGITRKGRSPARGRYGPVGWSALAPWLDERAKLPVGPLFCAIVGPTRGHAWSATSARLELHSTATAAGVRRRLAPHQLRHAHAVELLHEGIPLPLIQRQLGQHAYLSTTGHLPARHLL